MFSIESPPLELTPDTSEDELQTLIGAVYRQVLGNIHLMDNQRLASPEAQLRNGDFTIREFVRAVAKSGLYRDLFFETSSPYGFVEFNFKHLLGRAPQDQTEVSEQVQAYNAEGYEAVIDGLIDSDEYRDSFGEDTVPYMRGTATQTGIKNVGVNRTAVLAGGYATSDLGAGSKLTRDVAGNLGTKVNQWSGGVQVSNKRIRSSAVSKGTAALMNHAAPNTEYVISTSQLSQEAKSLRSVGNFPGPAAVKTLWVESESVELTPYSTEDDLQIVIRAIYRQVLGNAHVLEDQRLTTTESQLRNRDITVKEFVRAVAKSELYRTRFFETSSPYRFVELNFKHLLGRGPQDQVEVAEQVQRCNAEGYEAVIDSFIDSDEYFNAFGENVVPFLCGNRTQTGIKNVSFNRTLALSRGYAGNDGGTQALLISDVAGNLPTKPKSPMGEYTSVTTTGKRFCISITSKLGPAAVNRTSKRELVVSFNQLSQEVQRLHRAGAKISSITEMA
jgi:hypothetical protein